MTAWTGEWATMSSEELAGILGITAEHPIVEPSILESVERMVREDYVEPKKPKSPGHTGNIVTDVLTSPITTGVLAGILTGGLAAGAIGGGAVAGGAAVGTGATAIGATTVSVAAPTATTIAATTAPSIIGGALRIGATTIAGKLAAGAGTTALTLGTVALLAPKTTKAVLANPEALKTSLAFAVGGPFAGIPVALESGAGIIGTAWEESSLGQRIGAIAGLAGLTLGGLYLTSPTARNLMNQAAGGVIGALTPSEEEKIIKEIKKAKEINEIPSLPAGSNIPVSGIGQTLPDTGDAIMPEPIIPVLQSDIKKKRRKTTKKLKQAPILKQNINQNVYIDDRIANYGDKK